MSANQSDLSSAKYGYDFVVATTQASINATMKEYLSQLSEPVANICYVADTNGNPKQIDFRELLELSDGSDPFSVPNGSDPAKDQDLANLQKARFMVGFKAQLGVPGGLAPTDVPDIVTLGADTASVTYNLMCSQFQVVQLVPGGGYNPPSWMNASQPDDAPWLFTSKVDLRLSMVDQGAYSKLPKAVRDRIKNLGGRTFSIQQLLFDLDNAALQSIPTISGVKPGTTLYEVLQKDFVGTYFQTMKEKGEPLLSATITENDSDPSTLTLTDMNLEVCPYVGENGEGIVDPTPVQKNLATLNYLCAANGHKLPPATKFNWNWVTESEISERQGVVSINRNTFARFFDHQLRSYVSRNCYKANVRVSLSGFLDTTVNYHWKLTPGQAPKVTFPETGSTVLHYQYQSESFDQAGLNGDMGRMRLRPSFDLKVEFRNNQIIVTQHLLVYSKIQVMQTAAGGNLIDKTITDTYTLSVDAHGKLRESCKTTTTDHSESPSVNGFLDFFTGLNDLVKDVKKWSEGFFSPRMQSFPIARAQDFVFPGGKSFTFEEVAFSESQDLTSVITYVQPE